MKTIELSEVAALVPLIESGTQEPLIVTRNGATVAAVVLADGQDVEESAAEHQSPIPGDS